MVGSNHVRFVLGDDSGTIPAIAFNWANRLPEGWPHETLDVALKLERNEYRGESTLQARVVQIIPASG
jgi:single-stranded-DNA-specific exonuclease